LTRPEEVFVDTGIVLNGSDGVAISLIPAAARTFGEHLIAATNEALE
jgi:hypothetical protein